MAAPCQLGLQRVEAPAPLPAQVGEPAFNTREGCIVEGVQPASALGADVGEAALPQHPQLARDGGLSEPELRLNNVDDLAGAALTRGEQLQDAPPDRIAQDVEGLHNGYSIRRSIYKSCRI